MIHLITSEFRKLWGKRTFWIMLLVLAGLQLCVLFYQNSQAEQPMDSCRELDTMLSTMTEEEKEELLTKSYERIQGVSLVEEVHMYESFGNEQGKRMADSYKKENREVYDNYVSLWKSGNYLMFTNTLEAERSFLETVYKRWEQTAQYEEYLSDIIAKGNMQAGISIFAGSEHEEGYSAKSIHKTVEQYSRLHGVSTNFYTYEWVKRLLSLQISDCMLLVATFVLAGLLIYDEKKKNLLSVIRTTPLGRVPCMTAKLISLAGSLFVAATMLYLESLLFLGMTGGLYGIGNAVQSVASLISVPWKVSVWQYLLLIFAAKYVTLLLFSLLLVLLTIVADQFGWVFVTGGILIAGSVALYALIPAPSAWNWLHYCNLWSFLQAQDVVGEYNHLNWFEQPIAVHILFLILSISVCVLLITLNAVVFAKRGSGTVNRIALVKKRIRIPTRKKRTPSTDLFSQECYHFFWRNRGVWIVAVFLLVTVYQGANANHYQTPNEVRYRQQMEYLNGPLTKEKVKSILQEKEKYVAIYKQIAKIDDMYKKGEITEAECGDMMTAYQSQLAFEPAFQRIYERYLYVKAHPHAEFVYEDGYHYLLGEDGSGSLIGFLWMSMVFILLLSSILSVEQEKGLMKLIRSTPRGRGDWYGYRIGISLVTVAALYVIWFGEKICQAVTYYGLPSLWASVNSLAGFAHFPAWMPVWLLLFLHMFWQLLCIGLLAVFVLFLSAKTGNTVNTVLLSAATLLLPLVLALLGLHFMQYFSLYPFFSGRFWFA